MQREGEKRGMRFSNGHWDSHVFFTIFREQWEQMDYRHTVQRG
jgi:RimJ/RimL family protein N-acetyltransferase